MSDTPANNVAKEMPEPAILRTMEIMRVLDSWGLSPDAQLAVLGLQDSVRSREIRKFQDGLKALPENEETNARQEHILGIANALFTAYPSRQEAGASWMVQRNTRLRGRTPLQCILQDGRRGMVRVRSTVDCAWGWSQDDQHNPCWNEKK